MARLELGKNGSSGGHKGMNNIIELLKTTEIKRIRIGIMNTSKIDTVDYVLGRFNEEDLSLINLAISQAPKC